MSVIEAKFIGTTMQRKEWLQGIDSLFTEVEVWAREWLISWEWTPTFGWDVLKREKEIVDDSFHDKYSVPVLEINSRPHEIMLARETKLVLEPMGFNASTGKGRIDFYVWPALYRVRLVNKSAANDKSAANEWTIKTDSGIDYPLPWNKETFVRIAEGFLDA